MAERLHISDSELIRFAEDELEGVSAVKLQAHLENCPDCASRLAKLQTAAEAYSQFHHHVLKPGLAVDDSRWPALLLTYKPITTKDHSVWWTSGTIAACLALTILYWPSEAQHRQVSQLLTRAESAPIPHHRRIRMSLANRTWSRPAVWSTGSYTRGMEHVEALFVNANYSWDNPLSTRSFASWRSRLHEKRDRLISVADARGATQFYRVRTETSDGNLRTAALTLRSNDLSPVDGEFEFSNQEHVTMADDGQEPDLNPSTREDFDNKQVSPAVEHPVTPADELRVFAALNEIGADVDEPLNIDTDSNKKHIVVTGMGVSKTREQAIREALGSIPHTVVRFSSAAAPQANDTVDTGESTKVNQALRQFLEQRVGGAQQLQSATDRALDASTTLLARAHSLLVLAQKFPPGIEATLSESDRSSLRRLRHGHALAIEETMLRLSESLKLIVSESEKSGETHSPSEASWQAGAALLFERVRTLDQSVTKLLGANYTNEAGEEVLHQLPTNIDDVESQARRQARLE